MCIFSCGIPAWKARTVQCCEHTNCRRGVCCSQVIYLICALWILVLVVTLFTQILGSRILKVDKSCHDCADFKDVVTRGSHELITASVWDCSRPPDKIWQSFTWTQCTYSRWEVICLLLFLIGVHESGSRWSELTFTNKFIISAQQACKETSAELPVWCCSWLNFVQMIISSDT